MKTKGLQFHLLPIKFRSLKKFKREKKDIIGIEQGNTSTNSHEPENSV